jgi:hypothetical protein
LAASHFRHHPTNGQARGQQWQQQWRLQQQQRQTNGRCLQQQQQYQQMLLTLLMQAVMACQLFQTILRRLGLTVIQMSQVTCKVVHGLRLLLVCRMQQHLSPWLTLSQTSWLITQAWGTTWIQITCLVVPGLLVGQVQQQQEQQQQAQQHQQQSPCM